MVDDLLRQEGGQWVVEAGSTAWLRGMPESLRQMITQQYDALSSQEQRVVEAASVAGMTCSAAAVAAGLEAELEAVEACCAALAQRGQFLAAQGLESWPDGTVAEHYRWRHTLYQEVLYDRIPAGHRGRLHRRIGLWLEAGYGAQAGAHAAELAVHFERALEVPRAVHYVCAAAEQAMQRSAYADVTQHCTKGLALLEALRATSEHPQLALTFHLLWAQALAGQKGWAAPEVEQVFLCARALSAQVDDMPQRSRTLEGLTTVYMFRGHLQRAWEMAQQYFALVQRDGDAEQRGPVHALLGELLDSMGEFARARIHFEQALNGDEALGHPGVSAVPKAGRTSIALLAPVLWMLGYPEQALRSSREGLARAQALGRPASLALALDCATHVHQHRREPSATRQHAEALIALADKYDLKLRWAYGLLLQGWAVAMQGHVPEGRQQLWQGQHAYQATGADYERPYLLALQAEIACYGGYIDEGLQTLAEAFIVVERTGKRRWEAELHRLQGECLLARASTRSSVTGLGLHSEEAETCFHQALTIAHRQQAKSFELRAAMSLARLWQRQGQHAAAYELLAPIYGWFTEGFDTPDLKEAKALLEVLEA